MIRRRRPNREIQFSFDSFLDVVANVVGIILRLILVAWMGARAYKGPPLPPVPSLPSTDESGALTLPQSRDPLTDVIEQQRQILAQAQANLLKQLQQWQQTRKDHDSLTRTLQTVSSQREQLEGQRKQVLEKIDREQRQVNQTVALSLGQIQERSQKLLQEIDALKRLPSPKQMLRYRTPVSRPVQTDELMFECQQGRVTLLDVGALLSEIRHDLRDKADKLRTQYTMEDVTPPVGAFRLRYELERERDLLEGVVNSATPGKEGGFRYGLSGWIAEPVQPQRGEPVERALAADSEFRRVVDHLDPQQTVVTFWVYPDSFPQYRRLRDYLHERDVVVAGRPLMEGGLIASSRKGTASRGQ